MTIITADEPRVASADRLEIETLTLGFYRVIVHYGFMQSPNVPVALRLCERFGLKIDVDAVSYYIRHERVVPARDSHPPSAWVTELFAVLARNAAPPTAFYHLAPDRVVELGMQVEV